MALPVFVIYKERNHKTVSYELLALRAIKIFSKILVEFSIKQQPAGNECFPAGCFLDWGILCRI